MKHIKFMFVTLGLILITFIPASAKDMNYQELKQEYRSYEAPNFYKQSVAEPTGMPEIKEKITNHELKIEEEKFKELKRKWSSIIKNVSMDKTFFDFETKQSKRIRGKAGRTEEIKEILKEGITLDMLISIAFERNPGLKAAKKGWESVLEKYSQTTRLDNILRQYQSFIKDLETKVGPMRHKASIQKKFPFPGTLTLKGDIVEHEVAIAKETYFIELRNLITRIRNSYDELIFVNEAIDITSENLQLLKNLEEIASIKYSTGTTAFNDVIKAQIEISKFATDLDILKELKKTIIAEINRELNLSPELPLGKPKNVETKVVNLTLNELYEIGLKNQQEIKILTLKIEKTNLAITLAEKKFYPDFTLGLAYFENDRGDFVGVGKKKEAFPLKPTGMDHFWFGKNDAYVREARLKYQKMIEDLTAAKDMLFFNIKKIFFRLDESERTRTLYADSLLAQAQNLIYVSRIEYESGKIDFLNVLDSQEKLLDFNLAYRKAVKEYSQWYSRLEKVLGTSLKKIVQHQRAGH